MRVKTGNVAMEAMLNRGTVMVPEPDLGVFWKAKDKRGGKRLGREGLPLDWVP